MAWHCDVEEIQALLDGELDDAQRQECEAHLTKCESCAGLMDRLAAIRDTLAAVGAASPPPHLRELILEAVAEAEPVPELSCERAIEIASSYLDGELLGQERQVLEAHLFVCPSCYRAFKRMEAAVDILRVEALASAPPGLYRRLVASVERESQRRRTPVLGISGPLPPWRTAIGLAAGLAAAAAIVAAVVLPRGEGPQPMEARAHIVGERSVTLDLAPSATEEESGGLEHRIALAEKVAPTAAAPREVETRPARSSTPPARPTPIVAPPTMALRAVAAVTDREERGEDRQPAEAPAG